MYFILVYNNRYGKFFVEYSTRSKTLAILSYLYYKLFADGMVRMEKH